MLLVPETMCFVPINGPLTKPLGWTCALTPLKTMKQLMLDEPFR